MEQSAIHTGGCLCGAARYRTHGQPAKSALCHCRYCQARTGSAFGLAIYFRTEQVEHLSGELKSYQFQTESGRRFTTRFCPTCGTSLFWNTETGADLTGVAGGSFDPPTFWYEVNREVFTRSAAPFIHTDIIDRSETSSSYAPVRADLSALNGG